MTAKNGQARIVVGVDGSPESRNALRWAAQMAATLDAHVEAILVWEYVSTYGWSSLSPLASPPDELRQQLATIVTDVFGDQVPAGLTERVLEGSAAAALVAASKDAAMVVVGSRGHGGFAGLLMGSVSARVAEHAFCPVLVVHGEAPAAPAAA